MKGNISLGDFIEQVKQELVSAQKTESSAFYELKEVELEVTFGLEVKGGAKGKLFVVELNGETKASQTHKVTLKLEPLPFEDKSEKESAPVKPSGGVSGGGVQMIKGPLYQKP